ncbi:MAG: beta-glucosidase [Clostridiales bacterium]|nr:beta-glucosidase [Clostridiales bacterium]
MKRRNYDREESKRRAKKLLSKMTLQEKIGQVNQKLYGFAIYQREISNGKITITLSDEFKSEVAKYSGLGVLYGLYRADPWSKRDTENGLSGNLSIQAYNQIQRYVMEHSRLGIPMLLSSECPHGHQALEGYLLPVNLAMGATFHPKLVQSAYQVCGKQLRQMGVDLALISLLDILRDPRWGRSEECYSEDPYLTSELAKACVKGVQGEGVAVVAKHFCAQGEGTGGINASAARIGERELREIHLPAARACCEVGVQGVMAAYNEIDGIPCHANKTLLTDILRGEMGFDGIVMADGIAIDRLDSMTGDGAVSAALALDAGVDIGLWDEAFGRLEESIKKNPRLEEALDQAVLRVLTMKYERGLFEHPYLDEREPLTTFSYQEHPESLAIARESVVLLENKEEILPLQLDKIQSIAVIGPNSDAIYHQLGDYTPPIKKEDGVTVLEGIKDQLAQYERQTKRSIILRHVTGVSLFDSKENEIEKAVQASRECDVTVLVLGGSSSRFGEVEFLANGAAKTDGGVNMDCGEGVDSCSLSLPGEQEALARALFAVNKPIIIISIQGRPYAIEELVEKANAAFVSFYPGIKGGQALAELLFGKIAPSGCLPVSIPRQVGQLPVYYNYKASYQAMDYYDSVRAPLYPFGYGKSYSSFLYHDFEVFLWDKEKKVCLARLDTKQPISKSLLKTQDIVICFSVENTGDMDAYTVPQLYIHQKQSSTTRRVRELKAFDKIFLPKKERRNERLFLNREALSIWNDRMEFVVEPSPFELQIKDGCMERWVDTITIQ